jgi:hypothetical protein
VRQAVGRHDVLHGPVIDRADGDQQQLLVRDQQRLLLLGQHPQARRGRRRLLHQLGQRIAEQLRDLHDALQREATAREQALHARLGHVERTRDVAIGHSMRLQQALQRVDELGGFGHSSIEK